MTTTNSQTPEQHIVIAGGSGFLGQVLAKYFVEQKFEVVVLTRSPRPASGGVSCREWNGRTLGEWARVLDDALAVINLAGWSVNCRYHARNRRQMMDSRIESTRVIGEAIARCKRPPRVWLNSSTATIYRHNFGSAWDESGEVGAHRDAKDAFSIEVAMAWERAFDEAAAPATRKVTLRSAMVLGSGGNSVFPVLTRLARLGLGGRMASGRQFVSWIHESDFCRAVDWLIHRDEVSGIVNVAAPNPLTNAEMMRVMRRLCGAPFGLPAAEWMLEIGAFMLRTETELIIKSRRVEPGRLMKGGFDFKFVEFADAAGDLLERSHTEGKRQTPPKAEVLRAG